MIKLIKKVYRRICLLFLKGRIRRKERIFTASNGVPVTYYYQPRAGADTLVVVFSGFSPMGTPPRYNMVYTLQHVKASCLFILDSFGYEKSGAYYLSENGSFAVSCAVSQLIEQFSFEKTVFCGSSKGGTAALYFGLKHRCDLVVSGAPQCFIGSYLVSKESHFPILDAMAGDHSEATVRQYDALLPDMISTAGAADKTAVLLHYSKQEHTYHDHIEKMIALLQESGYTLYHDEAAYQKHSEVSAHFPQVCRNAVKAYLKK